VIRLAVRVPREHCELVLAELLELAPSGVEETSAGETVEYAVYGAPGELPGLPDLRAMAGGALVEISTSEIADDWHERWKSFHHAVLVEAPQRAAARTGVSRTPAQAERARVPALRIRPPWEPASGEHAGGEVREIVIDPGQAFGTGAHASTRLCLELLLQLADRDGCSGSALDVGTGSGVLAIAAAGLGFEPVLGLDNEQESVDAARENAEVNGVAIEVRRLDLRADALPLPDGDPSQPLLVLANLLRPLLVELAGALAHAPAQLIAGGLLREELDEISQLFARRLDMSEQARRVSGEWGALWLCSPG
jgi:ribosomal protein L11 methyltransferase